ncbi:YeiH family protein [Leadbetterella byssophila]|uniref:YeiH family protein n=1 Tax=Leadbetterella byssophila TaxID=316068 RepID=UPI0039A37605
MKENRLRFSEDWVVVIAGFILIFAILFGLKVDSPTYKWASWSELVGKVLSAGNLVKMVWQCLQVTVVGIVAMILLGKPWRSFVQGFILIFVLSVLAQVMAGNALVQEYNLEAVIFSLLIGLVINNFFGVPQILRDSMQSELFVKIGLVMLGTTIIFGDILKAGALGLVQALVVVLSVWYFAFWLCKRMKIDKEMSLMISSAVSICGVSAAIATSGAIKGDGKKLSYVISLVLITAVPMMIFMPYIAEYFNLSQAVTGAWLGGSIDTTGAVVASGSLVGEEALEISTIIKFSQNVLLGLAAFAISVYWSVTQAKEKEERPTLGVIWDRFPKFVIGFLAASLLFSFVLSPESVANYKGGIKSLQGVWFSLAFVSIGLETNFKQLFAQENKKPLVAFLGAQTFNVIITLIMALILFS